MEQVSGPAHTISDHLAIKLEMRSTERHLSASLSICFISVALQYCHLPKAAKLACSLKIYYGVKNWEKIRKKVVII